MNVQLTAPMPSRVRGSGICSLGVGETVLFAGTPKWSAGARRQIVIANLSTADALYVCDASGAEFMVVPAANLTAQPCLVTIETSDDIVLKNAATASGAISYIVGELFPGTPIGAPGAVRPDSSAVAAAGGDAASSVSSSGTSGSTFSGGWVPSGFGTRQTQIQ